MIEVAVRLIVALAVVVGLMLVIAKVTSRRFAGGGQLVQVLSRQPLSRTASVAVVKVGDRLLVLGTTDGQVSLLSEMDPEEIDGLDEIVAGPERNTESNTVSSAGGEAGPPDGAGPAAAGSEVAAGSSGPAAMINRLRRPGSAQPAAEQGTGKLAGSLLSPQTWRQTFEAIKVLYPKTAATAATEAPAGQDPVARIEKSHAAADPVQLSSARTANFDEASDYPAAVNQETVAMFAALAQQQAAADANPDANQDPVEAPEVPAPKDPANDTAKDSSEAAPAEVAQPAEASRAEQSTETTETPAAAKNAGEATSGTGEQKDAATPRRRTRTRTRRKDGASTASKPAGSSEPRPGRVQPKATKKAEPGSTGARPPAPGVATPGDVAALVAKGPIRRSSGRNRRTTAASAAAVAVAATLGAAAGAPANQPDPASDDNRPSATSPQETP